jgi:hypothetical protein
MGLAVMGKTSSQPRTMWPETPRIKPAGGLREHQSAVPALRFAAFSQKTISRTYFQDMSTPHGAMRLF